MGFEASLKWCMEIAPCMHGAELTYIAFIPVLLCTGVLLGVQRSSPERVEAVRQAVWVHHSIASACVSSALPLLTLGALHSECMHDNAAG